MKRKSQSFLLAGIDLFMNIAIGSIALFVIAFMNWSVSSKKSEDGIMPKADFLITLEWDKKSVSDIDLYVRDPDGNVVSFRQNSASGMFLDRDDRGQKHDVINNPDGTQTIIEINQEVVTIRGYRSGKYTVNAHYYYGSKSEPISISVLKLQPFGYVFLQKDIILSKQGQEKTLISFTLDSKGNVSSKDTDQDFFIFGK